MAKLHELLAVENDVESTFKKVLTEAAHTFKNKNEHFEGHVKIYQPTEENQDDLVPDDRKEIDTTVHAKLDYLSGHGIRYLDALLQKEATNQEAKADIVVDGVTLAKDMPATFLLGLETRLKWIRDVIEAAPTLPPGIKWEKDPEKGEHIYGTVHMEETFRTKSGYEPQILYHATKEHPAQVDKIKTVKNIGKFSKMRWSGAITPAEKSVLLSRVDKLLRGAKKARQRANTQTVKKITIGKELFDYILGS